MKYLFALILIILISSCNVDSELQLDNQIYSAILKNDFNEKQLRIIQSETVFASEIEIKNLW